MSRYLTSALVIVAVLLSAKSAYSAAELVGTVIAKNGNSVQVEFQIQGSVAPKAGDRVDFSTDLQGLKVGAGEGKVAEINGNKAWVNVSDNRPQVGMQALIAATGTLETGWETESSKHAVLGVYIQTVTADVAEALDLSERTSGVIVADVTPDSAADKAGLKQKDIIQEILGVKVRSAEEVSLLVYEQQPGVRADLKLLRNGQVMALSIFLGEGKERSAVTHNYLQGMTAYIKNDYQGARQFIRQAAQSDHQKAQFWLGYMNEAGEGEEQNLAEAFKWYRKSAEQGYSYAQYNLGHLYESGSGVSIEKDRAAFWYRRAAEQNHPDAEQALKRLWGSQ